MLCTNTLVSSVAILAPAIVAHGSIIYQDILPQHCDLLSTDGEVCFFDERQYTDLTRLLIKVWFGLIAWTAFSTIVGIVYGSCENGAPSWLFYVFAVYLAIQGLGQVYYLMTATEGILAKLLLLFNIAFGLAEAADFQSDAQQISTAYLCDDQYHEQWADSFDGSIFSAIQGPLTGLHIFGWLILALSTSVAFTAVLFIVMHADPANYTTMFVSNFLGMGGVEKACVPDHYAEGMEGSKALIIVFRADARCPNAPANFSHSSGHVPSGP